MSDCGGAILLLSNLYNGGKKMNKKISSAIAAVLALGLANANGLSIAASASTVKKHSHFSAKAHHAAVSANNTGYSHKTYIEDWSEPTHWNMEEYLRSSTDRDTDPELSHTYDDQKTIMSGYSHKTYIEDWSVPTGEENIDEVIRQGVESSEWNTAAAASLSVVHYYQNGSRAADWSGDYLGTSGHNSTLTMTNGGCLVTSLAMYDNFFGGTLNPGQMNKKLKDIGLDTSDLTLDIVGQKLGWTTGLRVVRTVTEKNSAKSSIVAEIKNGRPVIVGLVKKNTDGTLDAAKTHFVVAYGYDDTDKNNIVIYINDPDSGKDFTKLDNYLTSTSPYGEIYNLRSFKK